MVRTQIQLTEKQARELRQQARARGKSLAEVIRRHIDRGLEADKADLAARYARAARIVGRFKTRKGERDLSINHDRYLNEGPRW